MAEADQRKQIAVIDDDEAVLRLVELALEPEFQVTTFSNPVTALRSFENGFVPHLVVSDVMMPQMIGFDLHERTRNIAALRSVPFVFLSAISDRVQVRRGMSQGADDYITKPFAAEELRDAVRVRLERAGTLRENTSHRLKISSLGGVQVAFGDRRLQWEAARVVVLLLYLLDESRTAPIAGLGDAIFGEPIQDNTVRVLIRRLRTSLQDVGEVSVRDETVRLEINHPVVWDAQLFADGVKEALARPEPHRIEATIKLYTGEFLPGIESPWSDLQRTHYDNLYLQLLDAAIDNAASPAEAEAARARLDAWLYS